MKKGLFSAAVLDLDAPTETSRIVEFVQAQVFGTLQRRGAVVDLSGGVDSSVVAALCVRAFGKDKVLGVCMPEHRSSGDSLRLGRMLADTLGIEAVVEDISAALEGAGCYRRQEEAIKSIVPEYGTGWKFKLALLPSGLEGARLTVQNPGGEITTARLTSQAYSQLVAATNYKQRIRKMTEYYHADRLQYAVSGMTNRLEYDQGVFVKQGYGAADFKPIAHLYKTQVYQLARYLAVPEEIRSRPPATDTFPMEQTQEAFYFGLPYDRMDLCLYAHNYEVPMAEVAPVVNLSPEQVERIYKDIEAKRRATRYQHLAPLFVEQITEI